MQWLFDFISSIFSAIFGGGKPNPNPTPVVPPPPRTRDFGVQIHPFVTVADLALLKQITGLKFVRCDMGMDIGVAETDLIYNAIRALGATPIFITSDIRHYFSDPNSYMAFQLGLAARYPRAWWEICNEQNIQFFWPKPDPLAYSKFARFIIPQLRQHMDPTSKIISGGTSGIPLDFIKAYLNDGVSDLVDYVGFHPYGQSHDMIVAAAANLRAITPKPLFATEFGVSGDDGTALTGQATTCGDLGIPFVWYQLKDGEPNAIDMNNSFGLFTVEGYAKPGLKAAIAYASEKI